MDKPPAPQQPQVTPIVTPPPAPAPTPITTPVSPATPPPAQALPYALDWLVRQKPYLLISSLRQGGEQNISALAKKSSMSYVHAIEMLKMLEEKGVITTEMRGNRRMVKLTESGLAFASALEELVKKVPQKK